MKTKYAILALLLGALVAPVVGACDAPAAPQGRPKAAAASGAPSFNTETFQTEFAFDLEPQPLSYASAGSTWTPSVAGRYPKGVLLDCGANSKATIYVDMLGNNGVNGATNQPIVLACNMWHPMVVARVYSTGLSANGTTVYLAY
jgi:hypothetical protein